MRITEEKVRYVADLANLKLTDTEVQKFRTDLDEILTHVDRLSEVNTADVEPMTQVLYDAEETATLRADIVRPPLGNEAALANAPLKGAGYFKVPEVIKK